MRRVLVTFIALSAAAGSVADEIGANLVGNPGFEEGIEGWDERGAPIALDGDVRVSGEFSCRSVGDDSVPYPKFHWVKSADIPCLPQREYLFRTMIRASFTEGEVSPQVREVDETGTTISYHIAEQLAPGEHGWHRAACRFYTSRNAHTLQVYLVMRYCQGTAWYDDVELVEMQRQAVPPLGTGAAVTFDGSPGSLDMRVEDWAIEGSRVRVQTTGARYELDCATGTLVGHQRIEAQRESYALRIRPAPGPLRVLRADESVLVLGSERLEIGFQCDSLVVLAPGEETRFTVEGSFGGPWAHSVAGNVQVTDDSGGVGLYPYTGPDASPDLEQDPGDMSAAGWQGDWRLGAGTLLGLSIYPPRPYDWQKSFDWQLAHTNGYPPDSALETWSRYVTLVTLHDAMWAGGKPRTYTGPYEARDPVQFRRVIATCERLDLKLIPYMSPYYNVEPRIEQFMAQLARLRAEYGFHGIYYDGLYTRDWVRSYRIMRLTRAMFPDGPVYLHDTLSAPAHQYDIWCPFIDTYADIVLRGEGRPTEGPTPPYVRYVAAGYRLSNAIGMMKGSRWDLPTEEQLRWIVACNGRERLGVYPGAPDAEGVPHWPGEGGTLDSTWTRVYWPLLQDMRARWEAGELP